MKFSKITLTFLLTLVGGILFTGAAYAHAAYLRSNPGADAVIATSPPLVEIWFKQEVFKRKGENVISVTNEAGQIVSVGDTTVDDDNRTHILVSLQTNLPAGKYTVNWKNTSLEDGHSSTGSFGFTLDPAAKETSTPMTGESASATQPPTQSSANTSQPVAPAATAKPAAASWPCAASMIPTLGLVAFIMRRKRQ